MMNLCATDPDVQTCVEINCPGCLTQQGVDAYNAWADCIGTACATECSG